MSKFFATAAALSIGFLALATAASAQDFKGKCTDMKADKAACTASGWCRWTDRKPVLLPNGQNFTPPGYCGFKPGMKAGYQATAAK